MSKRKKGSEWVQELEENDIFGSKTARWALEGYKSIARGYSRFVDRPWNGPSGVIEGVNTTRNQSTSAFL